MPDPSQAAPVELSTDPRGPPRPSEHPLLAGAEAAPARRALEEAFGAPFTLSIVGEVVHPRAPTGDQPALIFVVEGTIRVVHLRLEDRVEPQGPPRRVWSRGRDPRVVDLLGPGCFFGLGEAWAAASGAGDPAPPREKDGVEVRREAYVNPRIGDAGVQARQLVLRALPLSALPALLHRHPLLREWLAELNQLGHVDRDALLACLDAAPLLAGLGRSNQNAVLQCATRLQIPLDLDPCAAHVLLRAGQPAFHAALVLHGEVELSQPTGPSSAPSRVVALEVEGALLMASLLADPVDGPPPVYPLDAKVAAGSTLLWWDRRQLQRVLRASPAAWQRLQVFADPSRVQPGHGLARLTVLVPDDGAPDSAVYAAGLGLALSQAESEADGGCDPADPRRVLLVDLAGGGAVARALGVPADLRQPRPDEYDAVATPAEALPPHRELRPTGPDGPLYSLRVIVPDRFQDLFTLVEAARAQGRVTDVLLHLPVPSELPPDLRPPPGIRVQRHDPEAIRQGLQGIADPRLLVLDALRPVPQAVIWLDTDPNGWWVHTDEAPERLFRVDRLTADFVSGARLRSQSFTDWDVPQYDERDDRPGTQPTHSARVRDDLGAFARAGKGGVAAALQAGRVRPAPRTGPGGRLTPLPRDPVGEVLWRLTRMVRRSTVGLALGGGGTWGAAHVGLIEELEAAGLPVDYVAGTSFGAFVGGIYAGGGLPALYRFLDLSELGPAGPLGRLLAWLLRPVLPRLPPEVLGALQSLRASGNPVVRTLRAAQWGEVRRLGQLVEAIVGRPSVPGRASSLPMSLVELPLPFMPAASNLTTHTIYQPYWLDLQVAVMTASSLAPAFPGLRISGAEMVDGAALANVPAEVLRDRSVDYVIAVNVVGAPTARRTAHPGPSVRPASPRASGLFGRLRDTNILAWLAIWKAGTDQARLAADALVDLHIQGVPLQATWRSTRIARATAALLREQGFGARALAHWRAGGRREGDVLEGGGDVEG